MTKEEKYREQMIALGTYEEIFEPELRTLGQIEREYTQAKKAWSKTAPPGGKPSMLDPLYEVVRKLRAEALQHRDALGLTPKAIRRIRGAQAEGPDQKELISRALDRIADSVAGYDITAGMTGETGETMIDVDKLLQIRDAFADQPGFQAAAAIGDRMDAAEYDLRAAVAEDMG